MDKNTLKNPPAVKEKPIISDLVLANESASRAVAQPDATAAATLTALARLRRIKKTKSFHCF
jgi:hypothetical protein